MSKMDIATPLLQYLRDEHDNQSLQYRSPPMPLTGGYGTHLYVFQLEHVSEELSKPLVLRLFHQAYPHGQAYLEGTAHNILVEAGYPAPPVSAICSDPSILGDEFIIMAFMPGKLLMDCSLERVSGLLAQAHSWLHNIDTEPIMKKLTEQGFFARADKGLYWNDLTSLLDSSDQQITLHNLEWLKPGFQWLKTHRPKHGKRAIYHGDFHPLNILVEQGEISAVLDWSSFKLWEPESDVANTLNRFCLMPAIFPQIDWDPVGVQYFDRYLQERSLDPVKVEYYEAVWCIRGFLLYDMGFEVWGRPEIQERLVKRFREVTNIKLSSS